MGAALGHPQHYDLSWLQNWANSSSLFHQSFCEDTFVRDGYEESTRRDVRFAWNDAWVPGLTGAGAMGSKENFTAQG